MKIPVRTDGQVVVTGSIAFDQIMLFPGKFEEHILPDRLHAINVSFLVSEMRTQRGGCSGNIGYTLALLDVDSRLVATAGNDFEDYKAWLNRHGVDTTQVVVHDDIRTASCMITTDEAANQITGFYVGAMSRAADLSLKERQGDRPALAIIAPDDPGAMVRHCREAREAGLTFFFDPSFQVIAMDGEALAEGARGAAGLFVNDYELAVFQEKTGRKDDEIFDLVDMVVVTLGGDGSRIMLRDGTRIEVPVARVDDFVEPTGAGDAYRAGFIAGLMRGDDLITCGKTGAVAAAYAVEQRGTQTHAFTQDEFNRRYEDNFGPRPTKD